MLVHDIEYGDGVAPTFFLRKQELAALFTLQLKKEPLHFHFDVVRRAVYSVNNYAALRLQQMETPEQPESESVALLAESIADSMKRMAAVDYFVVTPKAKCFEVAVIRRPNKTWVPHEGTSWNAAVLETGCLVLDHEVELRKTAKSSDQIEAVFPSYVEERRNRANGSSSDPLVRTDFYAFNSGMLETMVKIGKATKDATVYCFTPPTDLDPVLMRMHDENDCSMWTLLLMPVRTGVPVSKPVSE